MFFSFSSPNLSSLPDVLVTSVTNGQAVVWDSASGKWINGTVSGALSAIDDQRILGNVSGGSAVPIALTQAQTRTFLGLATVATSGSAADLNAGTLPDARLSFKYNRVAIGAPSAGDDDTQGFAPGSLWHSGGGPLYHCLDASTGAAVWEKVISVPGTIPGAGTGERLLTLSAGGTSGAITAGTDGNVLTMVSGVPAWAAMTAGIGGTLGALDNGIPRADGTGGATSQGSDLGVSDAATATQNNVALEVLHSGQANSSLVLLPKGTGALIVGPRPDGTSTGGNARGSYAVELQMARSSPTRVASGAYSVIGGGLENTCSGQYAVIPGGYFCTSSGLASLCWGYQSTASAQLAVAIGRGATSSHSGAVVINTEPNSGNTVASDRTQQFKVRAYGGVSLQTAGGTKTDWGKLSTAPVTGIASGDTYYDTGTNKHRGYDGSAWNDFY